ncbi:MAG: arylsulfatase [Gemmatimonadetes bacterium]|nr:arylsulfatase [Gemmatimonadota bacterium]
MVISFRSLPVLLLAGLAGCAAPRVEQPAPAASTAPPNIIFILADDLGYADVGAYGQRQIRTPRLDQMAREGLRFTQHYTGAPVCAPARSVLMTGQHSGHTTVRGNHGRGPSGENQRVPLRAEDVTVAEVLKGAGYTTGLIGKWGLGEPGTEGVPNLQGFDFFFGYLNQQHAHSYYPDYLWRNSERVALDRNVDGRRGQYSHDLLVDETLSFLGRHRREPFFLYLAYTLPHAEVEVPEDSVFHDYSERLSKTEATFASMVTRLDRDVGRILDRLRELGLDRNTIVVFSSDNGPHREGGHDPDFFDSNGPLRGIKRDLYEGGIRVPMIAWSPGRIRAGEETDHVSAFEDFLPTAAEIAGARTPKGKDGLSYLPVLLGREQPRHPHLYWEFYEGTPAQAVRLGDWKGIRRPAFTGEFELYDLRSDPAERRDLAASQPEVVRRMARIMAQEHVPSPFWGAR